ncbi:MAG: hypothetical protein JZU64_04665 [Rhodoferax sp.]|jgi:hypothetical protein|nr:hypothetical protein [Rhodoferax sp.]
MGKRFASVWDALPVGLRDLMPLQTDCEIESALFDAASALAGKHGFALVRWAGGYLLKSPGKLLHFGTIEDAAKAVRKFARNTPVPSAGAGVAVVPDLPENSLGAVLRVWPIETIDWTFIAEIATRARDTEDAGLSNEK